MTSVCHRLISHVYLCNCKPRTNAAYFQKGKLKTNAFVLSVATRKITFNNCTASLEIYH